MGLHPADQEMVKDITRTGVRAGVLLRGVILQKVDEETLRWGLRELAPAETAWGAPKVKLPLLGRMARS